MNNLKNICINELNILTKNINNILNKDKISNNDIDTLNYLYNEADYYNYYKDYNRLKKILLEEIHEGNEEI